jgi:hypothetical protein
VLNLQKALSRRMRREMLQAIIILRDALRRLEGVRCARDSLRSDCA